MNTFNYNLIMQESYYNQETRCLEIDYNLTERIYFKLTLLDEDFNNISDRLAVNWVHVQMFKDGEHLALRLITIHEDIQGTMLTLVGENMTKGGQVK